MLSKRIKSIIIISLVITEFFVWTFNDTNRSWSLGILGGADGPTSFFISKPEPQDGRTEDLETPGKDAEEPGQNISEPDQNSGNQEEGGRDTDLSDEKNREQSLQQAMENGLLILVNKENPVNQDYKPDDLEKIKYFVPDRPPGGRYMRAEAAAAFHQMVDKAAEEGVELKMTTAYRSYDFQQQLYESYVEREGEAAANKYSAKPGQSEHQTGLAVDVSSPSVDYQLSNDYGKTTEGKWLAGHAHEFGFIIRYPKGKEDITGYQYEPWHIRYVGRTAAQEIYEQNLTLEEYLQENDLQ